MNVYSFFVAPVDWDHDPSRLLTLRGYGATPKIAYKSAVKDRAKIEGERQSARSWVDQNQLLVVIEGIKFNLQSEVNGR